ncbi:MAG: hypothetical protein AAFY11_04220 [Cyanobacteria bacterium J06641_5]
MAGKENSILGETAYSQGMFLHLRDLLGYSDTVVAGKFKDLAELKPGSNRKKKINLRSMPKRLQLG